MRAVNHTCRVLAWLNRQRCEHPRRWPGFESRCIPPFFFVFFFITPLNSVFGLFSNIKPLTIWFTFFLFSTANLSLDSAAACPDCFSRCMICNSAIGVAYGGATWRLMFEKMIGLLISVPPLVRYRYCVSPWIAIADTVAKVPKDDFRRWIAGKRYIAQQKSPRN